jgi:hypothetical protein
MVALQPGRYDDEATRQATQAAFDRLYTRIAQRLEQNEALLDGLVALLRAVPDPRFEHLRRYSTEILHRYPHIHTVGYQVRIEHAQRGEFERSMSALLGRESSIRDYSIEGDRTWRVSPPRAFYYPAAFMAPDVAGAQDVIGYDGYGDMLFRAAIDRASGDDRGVATLPFDLIEGGRGYVFLRAFDLDEPNATVSKAPGAHIVSLLVRADRLIDGDPLPGGASVELRRRDDDNGARSVIAAARGNAGTAAHATWVRRAVPSAQQPFEFCLETTALPASPPPFDDLGASIAHELNQPLAAVVGYSQAHARTFGPCSAGTRGAASRHRTGAARQRADPPLAQPGAATHAVLRALGVAPGRRGGGPPRTSAPRWRPHRCGDALARSLHRSPGRCRSARTAVRQSAAQRD